MTAPCCLGEPASRRPARRLSRAAATVLPSALLAILPKCPLCLAAWLTAVTGVGFTSGGAAWVRAMLVVFAVTAVVLVLHNALGRAPAALRRLH